MNVKNENLWNKFIDGKAAVRIETKDQYDSFIESCDKNDLLWINGDKPKSFDVWSKREPDLCILMQDKEMCQASLTDCLRWKLSVVKFEDLIIFIQNT